MKPTTLKVFDFDWTLIRTPCPPGHPLGWWQRIESLMPPHVRRKPQRSLWIDPTIRAARSAMRSSSDVVMVITARPTPMHQRVGEIVLAMGIHPVRLATRPAGVYETIKDSYQFKVDEIHIILGELPSIHRIEMWEDSEEQLKAVGKYARQHGLEFEPHLVTERQDKGIPWLC